MRKCIVGVRYWSRPIVVSGTRIAATPKRISGTAVVMPPAASRAVWPAPSLTSVPLPSAWRIAR